MDVPPKYIGVHAAFSRHIGAYSRVHGRGPPFVAQIEYHKKPYNARKSFDFFAFGTFYIKNGQADYPSACPIFI